MPSMMGMVRVVASARTIAAATRLRAAFGGESGNVLILAAVLFPVVIGAMGLGAETGYWYWTQRKLQHAADVSAYAGALRLRAGDTTGIKPAAINVAAESGAAVPFVDAPIVNSPPEQSVSNPTLNGDMQSVEVIITRSQPRLFSAVVARFFGDGESADVAIRARAIAQFRSATVACVVALSPNASPAVKISGSTTVNLTGCDVHTNSNAPDAVLLSGSGKLTADCVSSVGGIVAGTQLIVKDPDCPREEVGSIPDPYADIVQPVVAGSCHSANVGKPNQSETLTPTDMDPSRPGIASMRFCDGLDVKGTVKFMPGLYIIESGEFSSSGNAVLDGEGVTFFLTKNSRMKFGSNSQTTLEAPIDGPFKGILLFGDRADSVSHVITGSSGSTLQGAIYTPGSALEYTGNSGAGGCTQIIANTVTFTGNSTMEAVCDDAGTSDIVTNQTVTLVE